MTSENQTENSPKLDEKAEALLKLTNETLIDALETIFSASQVSLIDDEDIIKFLLQGYTDDGYAIKNSKKLELKLKLRQICFKIDDLRTELGDIIDSAVYEEIKL